MKVTFIQHSSFLVETEKEYLLFDFYGGHIPELDPKKPLYIFASHSHPDHFAVSIFSYKLKMEKVYFILSSDIPEHVIPDKVLPDLTIISPYETETVGDLVVETLQSTDLGVAFIVTVDGKLIYHAGDLNCWTWDTAPLLQNTIMRDQYTGELAQIDDRAFFLSFVPLDPRQDDKYYCGMKIFLEQITSKHVFPMHIWGNYAVIDRFKNDYPELGEKIASIRAEGEGFEVE